jgi:hypothetical protein
MLLQKSQLQTISKTKSPLHRSLYTAPILRHHKRIIVQPIKAYPIVIDVIVGSIALYLILDVGSVFYKQYKNKKEEDD